MHESRKTIHDGQAEITRRKRIMLSIFQKGLLGNTEARYEGGVASADIHVSGRVAVDGVMVNPRCSLDWVDSDHVIPRLPSGDSFRIMCRSEAEDDMELRLTMLREALHRGNSSVFGVIIERFGERADVLGKVPTATIEERAANSMLVVVEGDTIQRTKDMPRDKLEFPIIPPIAAEKFKYVLIPDHLERLVQDIQNDQEVSMPNIVFVPMVKRALSIPRYVHEYGTTVLEVDTVLRVPNYYDFLEQLIRENPDKSYWVHGTRL